MTEATQTSTTPEAGTTPPQTREALEVRKLAIEADPDFLKGQNNPAKNKALVEEWNQVSTALYTPPAASPPGEPAPTAATEPPPTLPEGWTWHEPTVQEWATRGQELGLSGEQFSEWRDYAVRALHEEPPNQEATLGTLRQDWGEHFEPKLQAAQLATARMGADFKAFLDESGLGNDVRIIKHLAERGAPLLTARQKIDQIQQNRTGPYWNDRDPGHAAALAEVDKLYRVVYGDK